MVFTLCYRLVSSAEDAEDLTQEVFTKVYFNLKKFEERSAFSSWLYRIAYNHCLNFLDKRKRERTGISEYAAEKKTRAVSDLSENVSEKLQHVLNQLSEEHRSVLIMKYVMELGIKEISEISEVGLSAVKMRLLRAREEFRRLHNE